jgi:hypothetical protein
MLYGDDISKNVKEIQDVNRDGKKIGKFPASNSRGRSYYRGCLSKLFIYFSKIFT